MVILKRLFANLYKVGIRLFSGSGLYRFTVVRNINKALLKLIRKDFVLVEGKKLFLDTKDSLGLSVSTNYEPIETAFIRKIIKKDMVVVDVGANIGYYTLLISERVGEGGKVFSFEPDPQNQLVLEKNVRVNKLTNVEVEKSAVTSQSGSSLLYYTDDKGDQRIYDSHDGRPHISVPAVSLDDFFACKKDVVKIDFLKMDIQGAEPFAVLGMRNLIRQNPHLILCIEFWPFGLEKCGYGAQPFLNLLKDCGLCYFNLNAGGDFKRTAIDTDLINTYKAETKAFTNLICFQQS